MLVVRTELWPHGDGEQRQTLSTAIIVNDGTGSSQWGSYKAARRNGDVDPHELLLDATRNQFDVEKVTFKRELGHLKLIAKVFGVIG